jgi:23S rRNA U2552 (ribose-2'-O)-methylase RlmE/FtsJ
MPRSSRGRGRSSRQTPAEHPRTRERPGLTSSINVLLPVLEIPELLTDPKQWHTLAYEKEIAPLEAKLNETKSRMDNCNDRLLSTVARAQDPFVSLNRDLARTTDQPVTNAWRKLWEMITLGKLLDEDISKRRVRHFDNASAPGTWQMTTQYYIDSMSPRTQHIWTVSTLVESTADNSSLGDQYGLFARNPDKFLPEVLSIDGNVLTPATQEAFEGHFGYSIDFYTSDLGMDATADYNRQEQQHAAANYGQVLSGLLTLGYGGTLVCKMYTCFTSLNVSILALVASMFGQARIVKPPSSRRGNSETYIVATGYCGIGVQRPALLAILEHIRANPTDLRAFVPVHKLTDDFIGSVRSAMDTLVTNQIEAIEARLAAYEAVATEFDIGQRTRIESSQWGAIRAKLAEHFDNRDSRSAWLRTFWRGLPLKQG